VDAHRPTPPPGPDLVRWSPWLLRALWIAVAVTGSASISTALDGRSQPVSTIGTWSTAAVWTFGVIAMAVPATTSLTATRLVVPLTVPVAIASIVATGSTLAGWALMGAGLVATAVALSGEFGEAFAQASAYGDEQRFPLRPPFGQALVGVVTWILWSGALIAAPLLLAARVWLPGALLGAFAVVAAVVLARSWHRMSRRWLVVVPVGLVLHDHVVLAETLMLRRSQVARIRLAPADTDALDLTGPATGHAVEVTTRESVTALFSSTREHPRGRAVHLTAYLAGPTRPGRLLAAAAARGLPVG
jgi:hypothetical protein